MTNPYYNATGTPAAGSPGASGPMRTEFSAIASAFGLLPTLSGNGGRAAVVNGSAAALVAASYVDALRVPFGLGLTGSAAGGTKTAAWTAVPASGTTINLTFDGSTTGAGGMDTGTLPGSASDVSLYAIYNPTTDAWSVLGTLAAASSGVAYAGTHLPSGYVGGILMSGAYTDSSGNIPKFQQTERSIYPALSVFDTLTIVGAFRSISVPVPTCAGEWSPATSGIGAADFITLCPTSSLTDPGAVQTSLGGVYTTSLPDLPLITPRTAYYKITSSGAQSVSISVRRFRV